MQAWDMQWLIEHIPKSGDGDVEDEDEDGDGTDGERDRDGDGNGDGSNWERERYGQIDFSRRGNVKEKTKKKVALQNSSHLYFSYFFSWFQCRSFLKGHCPAPWKTLVLFHSNFKTIGEHVVGLWHQHLVLVVHGWKESWIVALVLLSNSVACSYADGP